MEKELEAVYVETGKVRLVLKFITAFEKSARRANIAAACAAEQDRFWPYYYLLMLQRASPKVDDLSNEKLRGLAETLGLNMETFNNSLFYAKFAAFVDQSDADGRALGVNSTPTFFINGIKQEGAKNLTDLQKIIDPMLK